MTIVVAAAAPDGIALATDSRTTHQKGPAHRIRTESARKVFSVGATAIATYGVAEIGGRSIAGLMDVAGRTIGADDEPEEVGTKLAQFFGGLLRRENSTFLKSGVLGFLVAGYTRQRRGVLLDVLVPATDGEAVRPIPKVGTTRRGMVYRGSTGFLRRVFEGTDRDELDRIADSSERDALAKLSPRIGQLRYELNTPNSLQDAVDLAAFAVRFTIDMERFTDGTLSNPGAAPGCGGKIQLAAVRPSGVEWIAEPTVRLTML